MGAMCARRSSVVTVALVALFLVSCGKERTGTAFCRQLGREIPAIAQPITTKTESQEIVHRYERLLEVAPLAIENDLRTVTDLLRKASKVDTKDSKSVQDLADASYAAKQSALNVREWAKSTCAVDISTGSTIVPPRTAPPTTAPPATTTVATAAPVPEATATPTSAPG